MGRVGSPSVAPAVPVPVVQPAPPGVARTGGSDCSCYKAHVSRFKGWFSSPIQGANSFIKWGSQLRDCEELVPYSVRRKGSSQLMNRKILNIKLNKKMQVWALLGNSEALRTGVYALHGWQPRQGRPCPSLSASTTPWVRSSPSVHVCSS